MVTRPPSHDEIKQYLDDFQVNERPNVAEMLASRLVEFNIEDRWVTIGFSATEEMLNPAGKVQGGILAAMLDGTMGPLVRVLTAGKYFPSTTDLHTRYFRPALAGEYTCTARVDRLGKSLAYTSAELFNYKNQIVASAIQTAMLVKT